MSMLSISQDWCTWRASSRRCVRACADWVCPGSGS